MTLNLLTNEQVKIAEGMLRHLANLQTEFWNVAEELEELLACEIDTNLDLEIYTIAALQEVAEQNGTVS